MIRGAVGRGLRVLAVTGLAVALLGACASTSLGPDPALLEPCPKPGITEYTNLGLAEAYNRRGLAIDECNAKLEGLRTWYDEAS